METNPGGSGSGESPSPRPTPAATEAYITDTLPPSSSASPPSSSSSSQQQQQKPPAPPSRYTSQKRARLETRFLQYLKNHKPPLTLARCSGAHVIEFLKYLDQFGKTKVHVPGCAFFGHPNPPSPCACPLKQAWGSLDALIGRLRAAYEEHGGRPESNPFGARAVGIYLREVKESQAKARGVPYDKKKRKRPTATAAGASPSSDQRPGGIRGEGSSSINVAGGVSVASSTTTTTTSGTVRGDSGSGGGGRDRVRVHHLPVTSSELLLLKRDILRMHQPPYYFLFLSVSLANRSLSAR